MLWNIISKVKVVVFDEKNTACNILFSRNNKQLIYGISNIINVRNTLHEQKSICLEDQTSKFSAKCLKFCVTKEVNILATATENKVTLWDLTTFEKKDEIFDS